MMCCRDRPHPCRYKQLLFEPFVGGGLVTALALPLAAQFSAIALFFWSAGATLLAIIGGLQLGRSLRAQELLA